MDAGHIPVLLHECIENLNIRNPVTMHFFSIRKRFDGLDNLLFFIAYCCSYILSFRVPISNISHQDPENDFHFDAVLLLIPLWFTDSHPTSYLSLAGFEVCFSISHVSPGRSDV